MQTFELNGVEYTPIQTEHRSPKKMSNFIAMAIAMGGIGAYGNSYSRQLPKNIDIITEYGLIQQKKSNLSRWERNAVVYTFEKNYVKVEDIKII